MNLALTLVRMSVLFWARNSSWTDWPGNCTGISFLEHDASATLIRRKASTWRQVKLMTKQAEGKQEQSCRMTILHVVWSMCKLHRRQRRRGLLLTSGSMLFCFFVFMRWKHWLGTVGEVCINLGLFILTVSQSFADALQQDCRHSGVPVHLGGCFDLLCREFAVTCEAEEEEFRATRECMGKWLESQWLSNWDFLQHHWS